MGGMDTTMLFTATPQLADPWKVIDVSFRDAAGGKRELRITVGYGPDSLFHCPEAKCREESCPVHDTAERAWRHSDFFQYKAHIHALVPRVACQAHGVRTVPMPWARPGSGVRAPVRGQGRRPAPRRSRWRTSRRRSVSTTRGCGGSSAITWTRPGSTRTTRAWRPSASTRLAAKATGTSPWSPT